MKWIIITTPTFISHEAKYIDQLLKQESTCSICANPIQHQKNASN